MTLSLHPVARHLAPSPIALALLTLTGMGNAAAQGTTSPAAAPPSSTVVITGARASLNKAQVAERSSNNIVSVISADDIGALPDKNAAEALARMPGISVQRDQGEGRYVVVRGLGPDLNSVTINGSLVPAPEASRRGVALDTLPAGMVRSLEVIKTLTPDRDANAIGGSIEVKTLSAFDLPGSLLSGGLQGSRDGLTGDISPSANLLWARRFLGDTLGVAAGASVERRSFGSDNVETGGAWTAGRLSGFELRDYLPERTRDAASLSLDWKPQAGLSFTLRGFISQFSDDEVRDRLTIGNVSNSVATPGGIFSEAQVVTARAERRLRQRKYTQEIRSLVLGGQWQAAGWTLDGAAGLGRASEKTPESINDARFRQNGVAGVSFTSTVVPLLSGPATLTNPASYALNSFTLQARTSQDEEHNLKADLTRRFDLGTGRDVELKLGIKTSRREKSNDTEQWAYNSSNAASPNFWGAGPTTMSAFAGPAVDFALGPIGPGIDPVLVRQRLATLPRAGARLARESATNDYRMQEDIDAGYLQVSVDLSPRWNILAGARNERTQFRAEGSQITPAGVIQPLVRERRYDNWMPALHTRFDLEPRTQLRAAWTNSLVRANFSQLAPGINLSSATEATIGNPDLLPMKSANVDVGVLQTLPSEGTLSVYVFRKDIKNFTYTTNLAGSGAWAGYTSAVSFANGDLASVTGAELSLQQPLRMLPGLLGNLIVGANATLSDSRARVARFDAAAAGMRSREIPLPGQSQTVYNLMLGYEAGPWSARIALNHKSPYLLELGSDILNAAQDRYVDAQSQVDLSLGWRINRRLQLTVEALNLDNRPYYVYQGSKPFNTQFERYGRTLKLGLNVSLF
ncbi:MAG: TonB-dependent receptor [Rubrivivax sp.]|nr:TonB-dependent receptor [Rubrivivax sp.]